MTTTDYRRSFVAFLAILALGGAFIGGLFAGDAASSHESVTHPTAERIEEDDPRWDCATMGNRECGPAVGA